MKLVIWSCATYGDAMEIAVELGRTFEEVAEPCREALRQMDWEGRHGSPIETAEQISEAWGEVFDGLCALTRHEVCA